MKTLLDFIRRETTIPGVIASGLVALLAVGAVAMTSLVVPSVIIAIVLVATSAAASVGMYVVAKRVPMKQRGFTLIELMVVIAILAIVASVVVPLFTGDSLYQPPPDNAVRVPSPTP